MSNTLHCLGQCRNTVFKLKAMTMSIMYQKWDSKRFSSDQENTTFIYSRWQFVEKQNGYIIELFEQCGVIFKATH